MPYAVCFNNAGYFLHQQSLPGRPASHGCVRLLISDAKMIFNWLEKGDQIIIK
jgi:lipoprotein-anchoring transpeptidase ErfK/SrfK